jgi:hypothetical protein
MRKFSANPGLRSETEAFGKVPRPDPPICIDLYWPDLIGPRIRRDSAAMNRAQFLMAEGDYSVLMIEPPVFSSKLVGFGICLSKRTV